MVKRFLSCLTALFCALTLLAPAVPSADAAVLSTPAGAGGADTVYVAGNPDWYPIEYYDPDKKCYAGVLPELLAEIGQETGLDFTYIRAGSADRRRRLAKNGQVELVSGCARDVEALSADGLTAGAALLTLPQASGETVTVCFAYTEVASDALIETMERALRSHSETELAARAVAFVQANPQSSEPLWLFVLLGAVILLLAGFSIVLAVRVRRVHREAERAARRDRATGIGNQAFFEEYFARLADDPYRGLYCVIFVGFDMAYVNQTYGEAETEAQLRLAASALTEATQEGGAAARVSGGFALARFSGSEQEAEDWTAALLSRLNQSTERYGGDRHPEFHAGVSMLRPSDRDCAAVLDGVRQGFRQALTQGKPCVLYGAAARRQTAETRQLRKQTLDALQNREFRMYLQFIVSARSGRIIGAEALSRWEHPRLGLLYPRSYIGLMESENTIELLDFYMFEEVCRQLARWNTEGRALYLTCNFTRISIGDARFLPRLTQILEQYPFDRQYLTIEITEDMLENDRETALQNIAQCKALGLRIALDDAGSGYTSFSDLRDYPIDVIKLDRSILNAAVSERGEALLQGMIDLAHGLRMKVLCEGVETAEQAALLKRLGCNALQGYYFYRAMPTDEAERVLAERDGQTAGPAQSNRS